GGYFCVPDIMSLATASIPQIDAEALKERMKANGLVVVDVRGKSEYADEHIIDAVNIPLGFLQRDAGDALPKDKTVVAQCASSYRSSIASSVLLKMGYEDILNLSDGKAVWSDTLPTE
ncbi:MAG: rhodanese-like domain-containing protein, partial [Chloroflexota bacterium]